MSDSTYTNNETGEKVTAHKVTDDAGETVVFDSGPVFAPKGSYLTDKRQVFDGVNFEADHTAKKSAAKKSTAKK